MNAFFLHILPLVTSNSIPRDYRQLRTRAGRNIQEEVEYVWPAFRYVRFSDLTNTAKATAKALGYKNKTWNRPGTADIEAIAFSDLSTDQAAAATSLGFTEDNWDCNQNHYTGYGWSDLVEYGLEIYWEALGFDQASWDDGTGLPATCDLIWTDLDESQKAAAEELCYSEETWDMVPLDELQRRRNTQEQVAEEKAQEEVEYVWPAFRYVPYSDLTNVAAAEALGYTEDEWNSPGTADIEAIAFSDLSDDQKTAATSLGFTEDTWDCDQNHYIGYWWSDLEEYGLEVYWEALGYDQASWEGLTNPPAASNSTWAELDEAQRDAAEKLCYFQETWDMVPLNEWYVFPAFRYVRFSELTNTAKATAKALGYRRKTWNRPGTADIEAIAFSDLSADQAAAATSLGFTEHNWDCNQNHYIGYWWSDLEEYGLEVNWEALGYDQASWDDGTDLPATSDLYWADLDESQKAAAEELCYSEETWDMVRLSKWKRQ